MADPLNRLYAFVKELLGRKVVSVGLLYLGGAAVTIATSEDIINFFGLPQLARPLLGGLVGAGFPLALYLAWAYDITPEGIEAAENVNVWSAWRITLLSVCISALALGGYTLADRAPEDAPVGARRAGPASPVIGILPFANIGDERAEEYATALRDQLEHALLQSAGTSFEMKSNRFVDAYAEAGPGNVAQAMGVVDFFIDASVTYWPDGITLIVELIDAANGAVVDSKRIAAPVDRPPRELVDLMIAEVERILRPEIGRQLEIRAWLAGTGSEQAFRLRYHAKQAVDAAEAMLECRGICESPFEADTAAAARMFRQADSLLAASSRVDPTWLEPALARGQIADRRALLAWRSSGVAAARRFLDEGMRQVDAVLQRQPTLPAALMLRGQLRWHMAAWEAATENTARLVDQAEADLRAALLTNPSLVGAAASLAEILYLERGAYREALSFAENAYRTDAFLDGATILINRAAMSALEMGDDATAASWCREGMRRFPGENHHYACDIEVMAWGDGPAHADSAWGLLRRIVETTPTDYRPRVRAASTLAVAGVLARAGLPDSALSAIRVTLDRAAREIPSTDFLRNYEAAARFRAGDIPGGRQAFAAFRQAVPERVAAAEAKTRKLRNWINAETER